MKNTFLDFDSDIGAIFVESMHLICVELRHGRIAVYRFFFTVVKCGAESYGIFCITRKAAPSPTGSSHLHSREMWSWQANGVSDGVSDGLSDG